jgi:hypothetical protein
LAKPGEQQRGGDVVGQVGDDLTRRCGERRRVDRQRVPSDGIEAPWICRRQLGEGGEAARVALDCDDTTRAFSEQRAGQTAGTGADLDDRGPVERPGRAGDPARQVEVEKKILPVPALRRDGVSGNDLAQRRQRDRGGLQSGLRGGPQARATRFAAISAASRSAAIRLPARATPRPAIAKAVP